ncbi:hypothetical protein [Polaromonas sp.]|uniref:hypothetical protein n=1 Tax=Polaromonas sp. TaxID=1869339 RepID=UPI003265F93B
MLKYLRSLFSQSPKDSLADGRTAMLPTPAPVTASSPVVVPVPVVAHVPQAPPVPNEDHLQCAIAFTESEGLRLDAPMLGNPTDNLQLLDIVDFISAGLDEQFALYRAQKFNVPMKLGGDCGNVHFLIAKSIQKIYPGLGANFVLGNVSVDGEGGFEFSQEKFKSWRRNGGHGDIYDCHSWITFGDGMILDATIATWVNTRRYSTKALGGILYGIPGALSCIPITGEPHEPHKAIPATTSIKYTPIALGIEAFLSVAPKSAH